MFRPSIQRKIVGIAIGLIVLMVVTSALSIVMSDTVHLLLDELSGKYIPAYGNLARANIRSLERSIALRQMVIAKMLVPPDEGIGDVVGRDAGQVQAVRPPNRSPEV